MIEMRHKVANLKLFQLRQIQQQSEQQITMKWMANTTEKADMLKSDLSMVR